MTGNKKYEAAFKLEVARMVLDQGVGLRKLLKIWALEKQPCGAGLNNIELNKVGRLV